MPELLHPIASGMVSFFIAGVLVLASARFPFALPTYVLVYFGVSVGSLLLSICGLAGYSGYFLVFLVAAFALYSFKITPKERFDLFPVKQLPLVALLFGLFLLSVFLPAHDPDSLNMHLTLPAQILEKGVFFESEGWFTQRLGGSGEFVTLAGLALGLDNLQAVLQFGALLLFLRDVSKLIEIDESRFLFQTAVWTLPLLLFLVPAQKPQLIGSLAVAWSAIFLIKTPSQTQLGSILFLALFATTLKHSFFAIAFFPAAIAFYLLIKNKTANFASIFKSAWPILVPLPFLVWNLVRWGDPLPPIFTDYLKLDGGFLEGYIRNFNTGFVFPLNLFFPKGAGQYGAFPGLGFFAVVWVLIDTKSKNIRLWLMASLILGGLLLPSEARFYTEFALVAFFIVFDRLITENIIRHIRLMFYPFLAVSSLGMAVFVLPRTIDLAKGMSRAEFYREYAFDFQAIEWGKSRIPNQTPDFSNLNSRNFLPFETIGPDVLFSLKKNPSLFEERLKDKDSLLFLMRDDDEMVAALSQKLTLTPIDSNNFARITRNPANRKRETYRIFSARIKPTP